MYESKDKMVSHPDHYQSETGLEVIDVIEAFTFDLKGIEAVDTGNALKYLCRWKKKNGLQDLEKAKWYLEHLIEHVSKLEEENKPANSPKKYIVNYDSEMVLPFENLTSANACLNRMHCILKTYDIVTVADALDLCGLSGQYSDNNYGWTNLDTAAVAHIITASKDIATLTLPKPHPISK